MTKPVDQCNQCQNRGCKEKIYRDRLMALLPCKQFQPMREWRVRLIQSAIYREVTNYGVVRHASRLHTLTKEA